MMPTPSFRIHAAVATIAGLAGRFIVRIGPAGARSRQARARQTRGRAAAQAGCGAGPATGRAARRAAAPRGGAACHNGMSFDRFLADLKQQAVAEGVSQRALAEAAPYLVYDQGIVNRDRGQRVFGQVFTEFAGTGRPMDAARMRRRESGCMRRRSTAPRRNMACRRP